MKKQSPKPTQEAALIPLVMSALLLKNQQAVAQFKLRTGS